ncbi:MAG: HAD-IIA family hydrolase [Mycobacteriales bacterium]
MSDRGQALATCGRPLHEAYDVGLFDLDGVVYVGADPVVHAVDALNVARTSGQRAAYVTNNASRSAEDVAEQLTSLGLTVSASDVVTSAQAAVRLLIDLIEPGAQVLVVGAASLQDEVARAGFSPVRSALDGVRAVVQGHDPRTDWELLAEAAVALRRGAVWVAANEDSTLPSPRGPLPGNGAMVAALATASGLTPVVAGKPQRPLYETAVRATAAQRPLFVGDRLDTDIGGAVGAGLDSLLVLTGVASLDDALRAPVGSRPSYLSADLRALAETHSEVQVEGKSSRCGTARAQWVDGWVESSGHSTEALRAACALAWWHADRGAQVRGAR